MLGVGAVMIVFHHNGYRAGPYFCVKANTPAASDSAPLTRWSYLKLRSASSVKPFKTKKAPRTATHNFIYVILKFVLLGD